jgi:hypothetical protein
LKDVPMLEERLFAITFKADFEELVDEAQKKIRASQTAIAQVEKSKKLLQIMTVRTSPLPHSSSPHAIA